MAEKAVTRIHGQPSDRDITRLKHKITKMTANIATVLGGGKHGHVGIIIEEEEYVKFLEDGQSYYR